MDDTKDVISGEIVPSEQPKYTVLSNGALRDPVTGRIVKAPTNPPINKENAAELARKRHAMTRAKLAQAIAAQSIESGRPISGPADAVADAGGLLWRQTVLNDKASDRERRETWLALGKQSGYLASERDNSADAGNNAPAPPETVLTNAIYAALSRIRDEMSGA